MAEQQTLHVTERTSLGKSANKALRKEGMVPGVFYNKEGVNVPVKAERVALDKIYREYGKNLVFQLEIERDGKTETVPSFIWNFQRHPLKNEFLHIDYYGVDLTQEVSIEVPVEVTGKAAGLVNGGVLEVYRFNMAIKCMPLDIPKAIVIDVTALEEGENMHIADVPMPEGVTAVYEDNFAIVGVVSQAAEVEEGEEGEESEVVAEAPEAAAE